MIYAMLLGLSLLLSQPALAQRLTLFHTGETGGLASGYRYEIQTPYVFTADFVKARGPALGIRDMSIARTHIYFYSGQQFIWGPQFGIHELRAFLSQPPEPISRQNVQVLQAQDSLSLEPDGQQALMGEMQDFLAQNPVFSKRLQSQSAELLTYPGQIQLLRLPQADKLDTHMLHWELLVGFDLRVRGPERPDQNLVMIGKPHGEGSRRLSLLKLLRSPQELLVDSGNFLEGLSAVRTNQLSLQREHSLQIAQALDYFAINVGKNELQGGLENLQAEQARYGLPLLSASLLQDGEYVFPPHKALQIGERPASLIALADSAALKALQELGTLPPELEILEPEQALERALKDLQATDKPELVIVLTNIERAQLQKMIDHSRDVHLILAPTDAPLQYLRESVGFNQLSQARPFLPSSNAYTINRVQVDLREEGGLELRNEQTPISFDLKPELSFLAQIMQVRHTAYEDALETLIPNLEQVIRQDPALLKLFLASRSAQAVARELGGLRPLSDQELLEYYPPFLTAEMLLNLEMNGLMESFDAEVVVFKHSESLQLNLPGTIPKFLIYERLKMNDTLELFYLNGKQLKSLLDLPQGQLLFGGVARTAAGPQVWGRPLGDQRTVYRALIPSGVSSLPAVRPLLADARRQSLLTSPFERQAGAQPEITYLRTALVRYLETLKDRPDILPEIARLIKPLWTEKTTLFSIKIDNLQLNLSGYNALNNENYGEVRDPRVASANSFTFGGRARLNLGWDNQLLGFTNGINAVYEGLSVLDQPLNQTAVERITVNQDDLVFSSELQLRLLEFPLFDSPLQLIPFVEGIYDTAFTPTINSETQQPNPLQSELRGVLGLSVPASGQLKTFKTGLALRRDFNVPDNLEGGLDLKWVYEQPLGSALLWSNDLDVRYFFPSPNDNASSLGLTAQWISAVKFSLTDNLSLRFYADSYLFQGKLPGHSELGASVILGVGLGFDRVWKPYYEPLF